MTNVPDINQILTEDDPSVIFTTRDGTIDKGRDFEELLAAQLVLNLTLDDNVKDFKISSNDKNFGDFDDVIVEVKFTNDRAQYYAMQLKYGNNQKPLSLKNDKSNNLNTQKYIQEYTRLSSIHRRYQFVIYTNRQFIARKRHHSGQFVGERITFYTERTQVDLAITPSEQHFLLKQLHKGGCCYRFTPYDRNNILYQNLFLYTDQLDVDQIATWIIDRFHKEFGCDATAPKSYRQFINKWFVQPGQKRKLTKAAMQYAIALCVLQPSIKPFTFNNRASTDKLKILTEAFSKFHIIMLQEHEATQNFWCDAGIESSDFRIVQKLCSTFQIAKEEHTTLLWLMKKRPLTVVDGSTTRKAIKLCPNLKFILIGENCEKPSNLHTLQHLGDLIAYPETYSKILKTLTCRIQGKEVTLELLVQSGQINNVITTTLLVEMAKSALHLSEETETLPQPYIQRSLSRNVFDNKCLNLLKENTLVVIGCLKNAQDFFENVPNIKIVKIEEFLRDTVIREDNGITVLISENECSRKDFDLVCSKTSKDLCHQFQSLGGFLLEWIRSKGGIQELKEFQQENYYIPETKLSSYELYNKVNIICADPGMGKTTLMKSLKKHSTSSTLWTIFIDVRNHSKHLRNASGDPDEFLKHILEEHKRKLRNFELHIFESLMKRGMITYLWDGVDEVSETSLKSVKKIIQGLSKTGYQHYITARNNLKKDLETEFGVLSRSIKEFDEDEQKHYILHRLQCSEEKLLVIFEKINHMYLSPANTILAIPLQIYLLTELILQNQNLAMLDTIFSVADLYCHFVEMKFNVYFKEKEGGNENNDWAFDRFQNFKANQIKFYETAAVKLYFEAVPVDTANPKYQDVLRAILTETDRVGFIIKIEDEYLEFFHNSFGEFFAACYIANHTTSVQELQNIIFEEKYNNIRFFFDLILSKDCKPHRAALHRNLELLSECRNEEFLLLDKGGRNALQLLCSWGTKYPVLPTKREGGNKYVVDLQDMVEVKAENLQYIEVLEFLSEKCNPFQCDHLFQFDSFAYAFKSHCMLSLGILGRNSEEFQDNICTVLYYCVRFDYSKIFDVVENIPEVDFKMSFAEKIFLVRLAVRFKAVNSLQKILANKTHKEIMLKTDKPLLAEACERKCLKSVEILIGSGVDLEIPSQASLTPLHNACLKGCSEIVQMLIDKGANPKARSKSGDLSIHYACLGIFGVSCGTIELLISNGMGVDSLGRDDETPLHRACRHSCLPIVNFLIEKGANVEAANRFGTMPIHAACRGSRSLEVTQLLLINGAQVEGTDEHGNTPLHLAFYHRQHDTAKLLIKKGANVELPNPKGDYPIHHACMNGPSEIVQILIEKRVNLEVSDKDGNTPLHLACKRGCYDIVRQLTEMKVNVNVKNTTNDTPLHFACVNGSCKIVELLIGCGASVEAINEQEMSPMQRACASGSADTVKLLAEKGADMVRLDNNRTLLHLACVAGSYEVVKFLTERGADVEAEDDDDCRPLHYACHSGSYDVVKLLIEKEADIEAENEFDYRPMHYACIAGAYEIVKLLLQSRATIEAVDVSGKKPIHQACLAGSCDVVKLLIENGDSLKAEADQAGNTLLHLACIGRSFDVVKMLIESGADIDACNEEGIRPIHRACLFESYEVVEILVAKGAKLDVVDEDGNTPLHLACLNGCEDIVKLFVQKGVDVKVLNKKGELPIDLVRKLHGFYNLEHLLSDCLNEQDQIKNMET